MEKKKIRTQRYNTFRTFLGRGNFPKPILWRSDTKFLNRITGDIKGFTLLELVIVTALVSIFIVATIAILNPFEQLQKASDARRKSDLAQVQKALESYYDDFQKYPPNSADYQIIYGSSAVSWGNPFGPNGLYMQKLPKDPKSGRIYVYYSDSTAGNQSYYLYASLERGARDPQVCKSDGSVCSNVPSGVYCGSTNNCNFGVSSSNVSP